MFQTKKEMINILCNDLPLKYNRNRWMFSLQLKKPKNLLSKFNQVDKYLTNINYESDYHLGTGLSDNISIFYKIKYEGDIKNYVSKTSQIVIFISDYIHRKNPKYFFDFIDSKLDIKGYMGSNEWKYDYMKQYKIPVTKEYAYLNPKGKFWDCNKLLER